MRKLLAVVALFLLAAPELTLALSCREPAGYQIGEVGVSYRIEGSVRKVPAADPKTFRPVGLPSSFADRVRSALDFGGMGTCPSDIHFGNDKEHVFFEERVIRDADPKTFELCDGDYAKDKSRIYYRDLIVTNADPKKFVVESPGQGKSGEKRFCGAKEMRETSFVRLNDQFAKDEAQVCYLGEILFAKDPATFTLIPNSSYAKDSVALYYAGKIVSIIKPAQMRRVSASIFADAKVAVQDGKAVPGVDPKTLQNIPNSADKAPQRESEYYKDSKGVYLIYGGQAQLIAGRDPGTFRVLRNYTADKTGAYLQEKKIPEVDLASFEALDTDLAKDIRGFYHGADYVGPSDPRKAKPDTHEEPPSETGRAPCFLLHQRFSHGEKITLFPYETVPFGQRCVGEARICHNGQIEGFTVPMANGGIYASSGFATCAPAPKPTCDVGGIKLANGESRKFYRVEKIVSKTDRCEWNMEERKCENGIISGSASFPLCEDFKI